MLGRTQNINMETTHHLFFPPSHVAIAVDVSKRKYISDIGKVNMLQRLKKSRVFFQVFQQALKHMIQKYFLSNHFLCISLLKVTTVTRLLFFFIESVRWGKKPPLCRQ